MATENQGEQSTEGGTSSWTMATPRDLTGRVLGDFQVERLLGRGGMGEVYLGRQISLDRPVALKILKPEWASDPTYMARFESEAWAAAKLNHPNIVHIYTLGAEGDVRFIAMEYVQGTNLRDYLRKKGVPELALALAIMRQSGLAVGAAGEAGLIHRDIKPENLLLTRKGQIKVADFGLAQLPESNRLHLTSPGMALGTPMYMSPEQVQGAAVDHRSDLYSLGVTFYHMLAGEPPFQAETAVALALKHVREEPPNLALKRPDLPKALVSLVAKLMEKEPARRHDSAAEMLRDLARVKEEVQTSGRAMALTAGKLPASTASDPSVEVTQPVPAPTISWRPRRGIAAAVGLLGVAVGAGVGWMARGDNVLATDARVGATAPALWLADWSGIPKQATAEMQYRYALTRSSPYEREAAWLAVPGRFPKDAERAFASYAQLLRHYLRTSDGERLGTLGHALEEWEGQRKDRNESPRERWLELSRIAQAGQLALSGDPREVASKFDKQRNLAVMDPVLAELTLEVVTVAIDKLPQNSQLQKVRLQSLIPLRLMPVFLEPAQSPAG